MWLVTLCGMNDFLRTIAINLYTECCTHANLQNRGGGGAIFSIPLIEPKCSSSNNGASTFLTPKSHAASRKNVASSDYGNDDESSFVSFSVSVGLLVVVFVHFFVETFVNQNQYKPGIYETTDDWTWVELDRESWRIPSISKQTRQLTFSTSLALYRERGVQSRVRKCFCRRFVRVPFLIGNVLGWCVCVLEDVLRWFCGCAFASVTVAPPPPWLLFGVVVATNSQLAICPLVVVVVSTWLLLFPVVVVVVILLLLLLFIMRLCKLVVVWFESN